MIKGIPNSNVFYIHGLNLLNVSWDIASSILTEADNARAWDSGIEDNLNEYLESAKPTLNSAFTIAIQGIEICLKGRISEISPFLLVYGYPKELPKWRANRDLYFADLRTIDAQDLIQVYNTFSDDPLPEDFITAFDRLRRKRNALMHTIDKRIDVSIGEVFISILDAFSSLFPRQSWIDVRNKYLQNAPGSHIYDNFLDFEIVWELTLLAKLLPASTLKKHFGFNKRQRKYICPICHAISEDNELYPETAQLKPNNPKSETLHCFICKTDIPVCGVRPIRFI